MSKILVAWCARQPIVQIAPQKEKRNLKMNNEKRGLIWGKKSAIREKIAKNAGGTRRVKRNLKRIAKNFEIRKSKRE
jgi:hypothetical protein